MKRRGRNSAATRWVGYVEKWEPPDAPAAPGSELAVLLGSVAACSCLREGDGKRFIPILFPLGRMFFGKNKVMMVALGRSPADEYKDNLHQVRP